MDRQSLEAHWNELRANLLPLRRLLSGEGRAEEMFDDLIDHNELGLALHTICDSLLERERVTIEDGDIEAIEVLHERMQIKDECGEAIRQHRGKNQKAL